MRERDDKFMSVSVDGWMDGCVCVGVCGSSFSVGAGERGRAEGREEEKEGVCSIAYESLYLCSCRWMVCLSVCVAALLSTQTHTNIHTHTSGRPSVCVLTEVPSNQSSYFCVPRQQSLHGWAARSWLLPPASSCLPACLPSTRLFLCLSAMLCVCVCVDISTWLASCHHVLIHWVSFSLPLSLSVVHTMGFFSAVRSASLPEPARDFTLPIDRSIDRSITFSLVCRQTGGWCCNWGVGGVCVCVCVLTRSMAPWTRGEQGGERGGERGGEELRFAHRRVMQCNRVSGWWIGCSAIAPGQ